jgi:hypothetical protein
MCRSRIEFVLKRSTWTVWEIATLVAEFIAKLVTNLIAEEDLVGLIRDGSQRRTYCAYLGETKCIVCWENQ